jgi:hypothetical protein
VDKTLIETGMLDPTIAGPADPSRVHLDEAWERDWWCKAFGCNERQLRDAVKAMGPYAAALRRYFGREEP